jgi:hypothetical protein
LILLLRLKPARIYVTDLALSFILNIRGLRKSAQPQHDIEVSSGALLYCLQFAWGGETLFINGRYRQPEGGERYRFFRWFSLALANSRGNKYRLGYYARKMFRRPATAKD